ncbi:hypothetical protein [Corynebacterium sp. A21]|uniref:hypothetical protein n=1 Tax=Corynebacterium sp. A21 TaxID=3457318 RepID=UPI003FD06968
MPMNQNFPEDELQGPETSDARFRYSVASPPNPWDQSPKAQAVGARAGASRSIALLILLLGVIVLSTAVLYGKFIGFSGAAEDLMSRGTEEVQAAQPPAPAPPLSSAPAPLPNVPAATVESRVSTPTSAASPAPSSTAETTSPKTTEPAAPTTSSATEVPASATVPRASATVPPVEVFEAPSSATQCAANVNWRIFQASGATSCPFAENVAIAMKPNAGTTSVQQVQAISPVTGESYQMNCRPVGQGSFTCEGGEGATVVLEHRHDLRPGPQD